MRRTLETINPVNNKKKQLIVEGDILIGGGRERKHLREIVFSRGATEKRISVLERGPYPHWPRAIERIVQLWKACKLAKIPVVPTLRITGDETLITTYVKADGTDIYGKAKYMYFTNWKNGDLTEIDISFISYFPLIRAEWINSQDEYIVVDYKSTSKNEEIIELNKEWQNGYKRQMEVYQWLLSRNGYTVSNTGYFVYCNGQTDREAFDARLEFVITLIPYTGNDSWVESTIVNAHSCLQSNTIPDANSECDYCAYRESARQAELI